MRLSAHNTNRVSAHLFRGQDSRFDTRSDGSYVRRPRSAIGRTTVAAELNATPAQITLAWLLAHPVAGSIERDRGTTGC
jgi:aryl-alcohol dehydrogenase-like predicted oxidoreductase